MKKILDIIDLIDISIKDGGENTIMSGGIIKDGYNENVDSLRGIISNSKDWLMNYQSQLIRESGISNLRIKYTNASGYFIEISKSQLQKIPDCFTHTQTLVNASRFKTTELNEFEKKLLDGESQLAEIEYDLFLGIREKVLSGFDRIKDLSAKAGFIDFTCGLAEVAYINNYVKPSVKVNYKMKIVGGRHPVIEQIEKDFISNNLELSEATFIHTITGPNMGGKSTFLRQNALIVLLSHIGSFVPAKEAHIPLVDKLFSRIGATDNLYLGQSTFMVEMQEVANILNNSTKNSFVIIDEVGRGTSTFDGMSLAWAILKENHDKIKAKTLFATHYHELIDESKMLKHVRNFSVAVGENEDNIIFLRKIVPGGIKKSYGLEVAKLAGLGTSVIHSAKNMLIKLENSSKKLSQLSFEDMLIMDNSVKSSEKKSESDVEKELKSLDINNLTPLEGLNVLQELKEKVK